MTDAVIDTVRVRGGHAARLARVAATSLPLALERALADVADCRIESLTVTMDVDPFADDETLAELWAGAIRTELVAVAGLRPRDAARLGTPGVADTMSLPDAVARARSWLTSRSPRQPLRGAVLRVIAEAMGSAARSGQDAEGVTGGATTASGELVGLAARILAAVEFERVAARGRVPGGSFPSDEPQPANPAQPGATHALAARAEFTGASGTAQDFDNDRPPTDRAAELAAQLSALAELAPEGAEIVPQSLTTAAGLALLYPWLADHCRAAAALHPGLDERTVRAHALASLVNPEDVTLVDDPLVAVLSGIREPLPAQAPLPRADEVALLAEQVLASFASLLPGFEGSSAEFVRSEWVRRRGLVDERVDPVRLTAESHPLDVMLGQLPYPLGLFRLPWAPPVMMRFRP